MDSNTLYMGEGGFNLNGTGGMLFDNGYLTSLVGDIDISFKNKAGIGLGTSIFDNGNIKTGLNIKGGGSGGVYLQGDRSNTFTGMVRVAGSHTLSLGKTNGAIAVSGNMNVRDGAKVVSHSSGQIAQHVHVTLESLESGPIAQLILENGIQEKFSKLTIDGKGIVDFKGSSKLIIDDLDILGKGILTVVGWEHNKDLFLVRKTSAHVKTSLDNIIFQGQSGRVHLEDYNKDYWELTTAPEPTTYGAIIGMIIVGLSIRHNRLTK